MVLNKICEVKEFPTEGQKDFKIGKIEIAVFLVGGKYYATDKKCPHLGGDLSKGKIDGKTIICPRHGAVYDLETGKNVKKVGWSKDIPAYKVIVHDNALFVDL
jgi:nitrite reductase/ring-hydroxylating ferredoxin subunit